MKPDDSQLIAYADGELSASQAESVERALAESADLRESVDLLRASRLPYREAFAAQKLPPLPDDLRLRIEAMAAKAENQSVATKENLRRSLPRMWLAAAFVAGAFCAGLVQQLGGWHGITGDRAATVASSGVRPWMSVAASYQQLYTRDTVAGLTPDPTVSANTVAAIRDQDGINLRTPDLRAVGMTFKSIERLHYNGKPLVRMVYLPARGTPVALCVMKDSRPDQSIAQRQMNGMTVVSWRQNELAYALIGQPDSGDLSKIARQISNGGVAAMFARNVSDRPGLG
ncbi:anti-sigma factor family protein [Paraburkholderia aromaticivorans]|uniref:Anti-sigma factor n=1 Tax=Paraburkholderia aromaticivorans TaxID=2026199 RepID=A0A248VXD5_9BURK|nr:anti-sigma factor [Paraburkholderia aromaticivorans]ASW03543.1 anti-sigma factor [Paraburkholderia aromaticivorans]